MKLLAFECANFSCSAAVLEEQADGLEIKTFEMRESTQGQGAALIPLIQKVIKQARLSFEQIDAIAVTTGAGSFTGVRIGLAAAQGFKLATGLPTIGINSFEVAAYHASQLDPPEGSPILVVLESRRKDRYCQLFDRWGKPLKPAVALLPEQLEEYSSLNVLITGNGTHGFLPPEFQSLPRITASFNAQDVGAYAHHILLNDQMNLYPLTPFYLRLPDTSGPLNK
jgi:tRNA threonylcarbamoyladenosine biosynthesis protein TsaB